MGHYPKAPTCGNSGPNQPRKTVRGEGQMRILRLILALSVMAALTACGGTKFRSYNGPAVTFVVVSKSDRKMHLLHHDRVLETYDIGLGRSPVGHKQFEGDGKTPEGLYFIDRRNPNSDFHLSVGLSYPNTADRAFAASQGKKPGGDIFIHGKGPRYKAARGDWTEGCIWVTDRQMEDIYAMVRDGTPIQVNP